MVRVRCRLFNIIRCFCFLLPCSFPVLGDLSSMTICEVLNDRLKYNGKTVSVRASVEGGTRHGYYLTDVKGDDLPCSGMPKTGWTHPSTLHPVWPLSPLPRKGTALQRDGAGQRELFRIFNDVRRANTHRRVTATFTGRIRTKDDVKIHCDSEGSCTGNGYGPRRDNAATLIIQKISDIAVE